MGVSVAFPKYDDQGRAYLTWRPVEVHLALSPSEADPVDVTVTSRDPGGGARLQFADRLTHQGAATLDVTIPADGTPVSVWVGGAYPNASTRFGDVAVDISERATGALLATHPTMVRVRKDANVLSAAERNRFLQALAELNGSATGRFLDFREMHASGLPDIEAHGGPGFLPWHRIYLLDLERELQRRNAEVALPYWRFDLAAPNVFSQAFMGVPGAQDRVKFSITNPLTAWIGGRLPGVERGPGVGAQTVPSDIRSELETLALGGSPSANFGAFASMQGNPHGRAHMVHLRGPITSRGTAPQDPLFFLLHCNVDRLWAKWQFMFRRHDPDAARSFAAGAANEGHQIGGVLWPWSGPLTPPRPTTAPGGGLTSSPMTAAPARSPRVRDTIDYLGTLSDNDLGFAYDDVPFQLSGVP